MALLSHSTFGTADADRAENARGASRIRSAPPRWKSKARYSATRPDETIQTRVFPNSRLSGQAILLIMPTLDAACNISFNLLKVAAGDNLTVGPILFGAAKFGQHLTPTATVRRIVNMTALTVVEGMQTTAVIRPRHGRRVAGPGQPA